MTKKKSVLFQVLFLLCVCGIVIGILALTGCGNGSNEEVEFNGDEYFVTSNVGNITNQEAFDLMLDNPGAIFVLLNLVDDILLRGNFDIDDESIEEFWEEFKTEIPDIDTWLLDYGFDSEDEVIHILELESLRESTVRHLVNISDEEIEEHFQAWYDVNATNLEDVRDEIYDELFSRAAGEASVQEVARLRYEAEFVIFNETLATAYENFLEFWGTGVNNRAAGSPESADIVARVDGVDIKIGQVFAALSSQHGLETAFDQFDDIIIANNFSVDQDEISGMIEEFRNELGDDFYEALAASGFESEEGLFEYLERTRLEEAIITEHFSPSEERLREMYEARGETVSGRHILVEDYDMAEDLISQLEDADNFQETFAEFAARYSTCGSADSGGDLGTWGRGTMVEEFDDAIFALEVGEFTTAPVQTQFGYHIIYKTEGPQDFEDIREELIAQEIGSLLQMPGIINEVLMDFRQDAEIEFTNPQLQARYIHFTNANSNAENVD